MRETWRPHAAAASPTSSCKVLQVLHPRLQDCNQISCNEWGLAVCVRTRAVRFEMSGLDWFLLPLINSCYALMFCIENCWMAFSEIKTTNSAFHNLTGDWREADSWMIASLGDFFFSQRGIKHTIKFFFIHVASFKHCCSACQFT